MNEWQVFLVIVAIVTFLIAVGAPVIKLNTSIVRLIERLKSLDSGLEELSIKNTKSHERIWKHNDDQDEKIRDHETRITLLEKVEDKDE